MHAGDRLQLVVDGAQHLGAFLETGGVLRRPPVAQHPVAVGLAALVVEAVGDLVADDRADAAIVDGRVRVRIEEGRLQDGGREDDLVARRVVVGVHRLGRHAPFQRIDGLADLAALVIPFEGGRAFDVAVQIVGLQLQPVIAAPFVGIADLHPELGHLVQRLFARRLAHPVDVFQPLGHGVADVADQGLHLRLGRGGEVQADIFLGQDLAQLTVDQGHAPVPARSVLGLAAQRLAPELEAAVDEGLRQIGAGLIDHVERLPGLQRLYRGVGEHLGDAGDGGVLHQHQGLDVRHLGARQEGGPVDAGGQGRQVRRLGRIVQLVDLAALDRGPVLLGYPGLEGQDVGGGLGRIGPADGRQGAGQIGQIGLALSGEVRLQIVVAVRQAQAALTQIGRVHVRLLQVLEHVDAEQGGAETFVALPHQPGHAGVVGDGLDRRQIGGQRGRRQLIDPGLVHEAGVQGADLLGVGVDRVGGAGFDDGLQLALGVLVKHVERAEPGLVRRNLGGAQIGAVGVFIEVVARLHRGVATGQVEAPGPERRRRARQTVRMLLGRGRAAGQGDDDTGRTGGHQTNASHGRQGPDFDRRHHRAGAAVCRMTFL